ncbi:MAG: Xaa-Pro peptidase family protein [Nitriliruptoraceae bacterium]
MSAGHVQRLDRTVEALRAQGLTGLLVGPSADLRWLVGYEALPLERLTLLAVPADGEPFLLVPRLEQARAQACGAGDLVELVAWSETEDPVAIVSRRLGAGDGPRRFAVQDRMWSMFTLRLQAALDDASWVPGSTIMRDLRIRKQPEEIEALRAAGQAIDAVHAQMPDLLRPGRTERDVGRDVAERILDEHDVVNFVIIGSGPNGASPHHETGDRVLERGDAVVVDIGGARGGYCSDSTRNYVLGPATKEYQHLHDVLQRAHRAAVEAVCPGVAAASIDRAARKVIIDAGMGERFIHRTGHGIGLEEHEEPWIVEGNEEPVEAGMAFSVEPGIYVEGRFGARIEDIVVVTDVGVDLLNRRPRDLIVCD